MVSFKQEIDELNLQITELEKEISILEFQIKDIQEDKFSYKRKNDYSALKRAVNEEKEIKSKIDFRLNEISHLKNRVESFKQEEQQSEIIKRDMDKFLNQLKLGNNRVQASKKTRIPLSTIHKWYNDGKNNENKISVYFYNQVNYIEDYFHGFYDILKREFKSQNKISITRPYVPESYPRRLDRFYNEDSRLWFARLELRKQRSIYYFGLKGEKEPKLILVFDYDINQSNFSYYNREVLIRLEINDVTNIKNDFKLRYVNKDKHPNHYYLSLGDLYGGEMSKNIELLITEYDDFYFNYLERLFKVAIK